MAIEDTLDQEAQTQTDPNAALVLSTAATVIRDLRKKLERAKKRCDILDALEEAGVDNWEGYGEAMSILHGDEDEDDD